MSADLPTPEYDLSRARPRAGDDERLSLVLNNAQTIVDDLGGVGQSQAAGFIASLVAEVTRQRDALDESNAPIIPLPAARPRYDVPLDQLDAIIDSCGQKGWDGYVDDLHDIRNELVERRAAIVLTPEEADSVLNDNPLRAHDNTYYDARAKLRQITTQSR
jgi:hypothetical protein